MNLREALHRTADASSAEVDSLLQEMAEELAAELEGDSARVRDIFNTPTRAAAESGVISQDQDDRVDRMAELIGDHFAEVDPEAGAALSKEDVAEMLRKNLIFFEDPTRGG